MPDRKQSNSIGATTRRCGSARSDGRREAVTVTRHRPQSPSAAQNSIKTIKMMDKCSYRGVAGLVPAASHGAAAGIQKLKLKSEPIALTCIFTSA